VRVKGEMEKVLKDSEGYKAGLPNTACRGLRGNAGEKIKFGQIMESLEAG